MQSKPAHSDQSPADWIAKPIIFSLNNGPLAACCDVAYIVAVSEALRIYHNCNERQHEVISHLTTEELVRLDRNLTSMEIKDVIFKCDFLAGIVNNC